MKTYKRGDKLRCVSRKHIYTFLKYNLYGNIVLEEYPNGVGWVSSQFVPVEEDNSLGAQVSRAYALIGDRVKYGETSYKIDRVLIIQKGTLSSYVVNEYLQTHEFCVALGCDSSTIPLESIENISKAYIIENVGDFTAKVEKDLVTVGCQKIPWEKVQEIYDAHAKL